MIWTQCKEAVQTPRLDTTSLRSSYTRILSRDKGAGAVPRDTRRRSSGTFLDPFSYMCHICTKIEWLKFQQGRRTYILQTEDRVGQIYDAAGFTGPRLFGLRPLVGLARRAGAPFPTSSSSSSPLPPCVVPRRRTPDAATQSGCKRSEEAQLEQKILSAAPKSRGTLSLEECGGQITEQAGSFRAPAWPSCLRG